MDIAICTIEKANSLINRLIDDEQIFDLGIIVIDELHMVNDEYRGYIIELILSKIKYLCLKFKEYLKLLFNIFYDLLFDCYFKIK